jgi:hypothetical protein
VTVTAQCPVGTSVFSGGYVLTNPGAVNVNAFPTVIQDAEGPVTAAGGQQGWSVTLAPGQEIIASGTTLPFTVTAVCSTS